MFYTVAEADDAWSSSGLGAEALVLSDAVASSDAAGARSPGPAPTAEVSAASAFDVAAHEWAAVQVANDAFDAVGAC